MPNDAQDFAFTAGGGLSPTSFSLDDDGDGTLSNTRTFDDLNAASGYSLAESGAERLDPGKRDLRRRQPRVEHRCCRGRDGHVHVPQPARLPAAEGRDSAEDVLGAGVHPCLSPNRVHGPRARVPILQPARPDVAAADDG